MLYLDSVLASDQPRYERVIREMFQLGLWPFLDADEKRALANAVIKVSSKRGLGPFDARACASVGGLTVTLPVLTLKFAEDLSVAYAWRDINKHSLQPMDEYVAMLKHRPDAFARGQASEPLIALGVPPGILEQDRQTSELSLRLRNTTYAFILAHELGHLRHRHQCKLPIDPDLSQKNEQAADEFAMDLLSRSSTIPLGMMLWLQANVGYMPNRADFKTDAEYREWIRTKATHPVNSERLRSLAASLERIAARTASGEHAESMRFIAKRLTIVAGILADPDQQLLICHCAMSENPEDLKRLDDRPCIARPEDLGNERCGDRGRTDR